MDEDDKANPDGRARAARAFPGGRRERERGALGGRAPSPKTRPTHEKKKEKTALERYSVTSSRSNPLKNSQISADPSLEHPYRRSTKTIGTSAMTKPGVCSHRAAASI